MKSCPLPLLYTLVSAAQLIKRQWRKFLWLSWPHLVITQLGGWLLSNPFFSEQMPLVFLTGIVMIGVTAWVTVRMHRAILLDHPFEVKNPQPVSGLRELRVIGYWLLLFSGLLVLIFLLIFSVMALFELSFFGLVLLFFLLAVPVIWLFSRCLLVIPAVSIDDEPRGLSTAWRLSQPYQISLFLLVGVLPLGVGVVAYQLAQWHQSVSLSLLVNLLGYAFWIYELCLLSLSYRWIKQRKQIDSMLDTSSNKPSLLIKE